MVYCLHYRVDDYIDIPAIPELASTNELTMAVCMRGHSQRAAAVEFNVPSPSNSWLELHFWILQPTVLYVSPGDSANSLQTDLSAYNSWFHAAYTISAQGLKLYVDGDLKESNTINDGVLALPYNIRVGRNPNGREPNRYVAVYTELYKI